MINSIEIKNYKCFKHRLINFNKANLLLGTNSGGKSSVIQTILLSKMASNGIKQQLKSLDLSTNEYELNLYGFDEIIADNADEDSIYLKLKYDNYNIGMEFLPTDDNNVVSINFDSDNKEFNNNIIYLGAERVISKEQKNGNIDNIMLGHSNEYIGYIIEKGKKKLIDVDISRNHWESKDINFLDMQINSWLNYVLPGSKVSTSSGKDNNISLIFGTNSHQTNIGYGVSFVLPIIVAGLIAKSNSIIVVENPELHLHPQAQSRIAIFLAMIASAGVQVIIETHSEHIVNGFRKSLLSNNHPLDSSDLTINYFSVINSEAYVMEEVTLNENAEITHWPEGFMDQEEKDLFEMRKMRLANGKKNNY